MKKSIDTGNKTSLNISKSNGLNNIINSLFNNMNADGEANGEATIEQAYKFFNQPYFSGEESLINKLIEISPTLSFDDIKDEGINLATLKHSNWESDFKKCLNNIKNSEIKKAFVKEIFEKIQAEIGSNPQYNDFSSECDISDFSTGTTSNVLTYFQKVIDYLNGKENIEGTRKAIKILENVTINNENLNRRLLSGEQIPSGIPLKDDSIPSNTKESFDALLSFEMSKQAEQRINKANDISNKVLGLFSNTFPAINTIISENEEYKFDESKFKSEYKEALDIIINDKNLSETEKKNQINDLEREYYIDYLKNIEPDIGNIIEQLYNNDFDYSKVDNSVLSNYLEKITDLNLESFSKNGINGILEATFGNRDLESFSRFYKELANPNIKEMHLDIAGDTESPGIDIPIEKTIISSKNPSLKNINAFGKNGASQDCMPFQYKIKKKHIEELNISEDDKTNLMNFLSTFQYEEDIDNYIINGTEAGNLIYLFFVINGKISKSHLNDSVEQEKLGELLDNKEIDTEEKESEEEKQNEIKNFINKIEGRGPGNKFENGSEIWLPMGKSELPGGKYQWMKIKVSNFNKEKGTFTGTVFGGELKFDTDIEGKSRQFTMNERTINEIEKISKDSNKIWLLPNPDKLDFNSYKNKLNGRLGTSNLSFPEGTKWNGKKFMGKNEKGEDEEIKYFGVPGDDSVSYKIEYKQSNRSFKVSTTYNGKAEKNNGKTENVRYSYSRDMDRNNFLIFFSQKGLIPQSELDSQKAKINQERNFKIVNGGKWKLNWFSLNNFKNLFKSISGAIKKKIDDYNKSQDEKLQDILIGDRGLYGKLAKVLGFIPSIKQGLGELEQEYYNERDNRTWKKIEKYYKDFCADYDFADTFDQEPPYIKIKGKGSLKDQVLSRVANATNVMGDPGIYQAAGLLLANIEKGGSPYRGLSGHENEGLWVKALLGNVHYNRFLEHKRQCIKSFETEKNKDKLQDALANSEMTYITDNIFGRNRGLLFGAGIESRGDKENPEGTNYKENPSKGILSEQFAKKLDDLTKDRFNKDGVIGKMPKHNYFEKAEKDFYRLITSSRFPDAMAELEGMISLARTESQIYTTKKCYLLVMLSGILDFNGNKSMRKFAYTQGKTLGFAPAMLAKNVGHSEEIASLLDDFSEGDFSKNVTAYCHKKDLVNGSTNIPTLITQLNDWFSEKKMNQFDEYIESIPGKNWDNKSAALRSLKDDLTDYDNQNPDDIIIRNSKFLNSAGLNASADAVDTRLIIDDSGQFKGKDQDEKSDMSKFWESCADKIEAAKKTLDGPEGANYANQMLEKYLGRFGITGDNKQTVYKWINTADRYKNMIDKQFEKSNKTYLDPVKGKYCYISQEDVKTLNEKGETVTIPNVPLGKMYESDIDKILRYGIEGFIRTHSRLGSRQLPRQLKRALDNFQSFFEKAFTKNYFSDISKKIYSESKIINLGGWSVYETLNRNKGNEVYVESEDSTISSDKESIQFNSLPGKEKKRILKSVFDSDNYGNSDINNMRQSIKRHGVTLGDERSLYNDSIKPAEKQQKYS